MGVAAEVLSLHSQGLDRCELELLAVSIPSLSDCSEASDGFGVSPLVGSNGVETNRKDRADLGSLSQDAFAEDCVETSNRG